MTTQNSTTLTETQIAALAALEWGEIENCYHDDDEIAAKRPSWEADAAAWTALRDSLADANATPADRAGILAEMASLESDWGDDPSTRQAREIVRGAPGLYTELSRAQEEACERAGAEIARGWIKKGSADPAYQIEAVADAEHLFAAYTAAGGEDDFGDRAGIFAAGLRGYQEAIKDAGIVRCECGNADVGGEPCAWTGPEDETVAVRYVPRQHRGTAEAARTWAGVEVLLSLHPDCAELLREDSPDWTVIEG